MSQKHDQYIYLIGVKCNPPEFSIYTQWSGFLLSGGNQSGCSIKPLKSTMVFYQTGQELDCLREAAQKQNELVRATKHKYTIIHIK